MDVVVYTSPINFAGEYDYLYKLLEAGLKQLHVYKPGMNSKEIMDWLNQLGEMRWDKMILHLYDDFIPVKVQGYHLSRSYLKSHSFEETAATTQLLSVSAHNAGDWVKWKDIVAIITVSPVYASISKSDEKAVHSPNQWKDIFIAHPGNAKKIALGGIDPTKSTELSNTGFDGMALSGWLWANTSRTSSRIDELCKILSNDRY